MTSSRLIPNTFAASQASLSNSTLSLDGNKSEISPSAIPNILALPAILPAVLSLPANVVALLGPNDFPDFPPGFGAVALGFRVVPSGLTPGFGVVPSGFDAPSYFHPSHLKVDPDGGGAAGGAVNVVLAIDPALAFTLKVRAGAEGAAALVPAVALASKAAGGVGDAVATGEAVGKLLLLGDADNISPLFDLPRTFPQFGAVLLLTRALASLASLYCLGTISFVVAIVAGETGAAAGAPYFHPSHLEVDPNFGAEGRAVNVPDVALALPLGAEGSVVGSAAGALGVVPSHLKVDPGFGVRGRAVNILEVAPALGAAVGAALAALSLAALY